MEANSFKYEFDGFFLSEDIRGTEVLMKFAVELMLFTRFKRKNTFVIFCISTSKRSV